MSTQERDRKQIACLICIMIIASFMPACTHFSIEYPSNKEFDCSDWVIANRLPTDIVYHGVYNQSKTSTHVWIEREGRCYDIMQPSGFDCSDKLYKANSIFVFDGDNITIDAISSKVTR